MEFLIRAARPDDFDGMFALVEQFATSFRPERSAFVRAAEILVGQDDAWLGVAESTSRLIGYCLGFDHMTFYANGRVSWVEEIMVAESGRRQGIGRALMAEFERWAESRGSRLVGLATRRAAPFYDALGYEASATYYRKIL